MGTITLTPPVAGTAAVAGTFTTAFTTLQTVINGNLDTANLAAGAAIKNSQLATGLTNGPPGLELAYNEFTSNVSVTATTEGTANTVVTASAVSCDGATPVVIEFYTLQLAKGSTYIRLFLYDGAASVGMLAENLATGPVVVQRKLTPSNASHTFSIRGSVDAGTGTVVGGAGGLAASMPGYIRITKA